MADNSSDDPQLNEACRQVGRFMYQFALLEEALGGIIQKALELDDTQARILAATIPLARKVEAARSIIDAQRGKGQDWRKSANSDIEAVNSFNNDRKMIAHAGFSPTEGKAVQFRYATVGKVLDQKDPIWDKERFRAHYDEMDRIQERLERIKGDLMSIAHAAVGAAVGSSAAVPVSESLVSSEYDAGGDRAD